MSDSPKKAVNDMFNEAKTQLSEENIFSSLIQGEDGEKEAQKLLFENLSWKILNETQQGDTATVEVEVTNKDFKAILNNLQQKVFKLALNGEDINNEKTEQYLLEELGNDEIGNVTSTCNITVNKQNGKWEVSEENDITNILLPGFDEAVNELY